MNRRLTLVLVVVSALIALTGCEFRGVNESPLPLTKGRDGYEITVVMENAVNLVPNSQVKVNDVNVGSVKRIRFDDWKARLTLGIEDDVQLPKSVTAKIAQKSLLGAEYLELEVPAENPSGEVLADGDIIGLDRTGRYPETEEVLSSLSLLLSGGGLGQLKTITTELNKALGGNEADVRSLLAQLRTFTGTLDAQKQNIVKALDGLNRLASTVRKQDKTLDNALVTLPKGVDVLVKERASLVRTLTALGEFGDVVTRIDENTGEDLAADLRNLAPALKGVADSGDDLLKALRNVSFPFPLEAVEKGFKGDYINFFATIDVSAGAIERDFLSGVPLTSADGLFTALLGLIPSGATVDNTNPLTDPLKGGKPAPKSGLPKTTDDLLGGLLDGLKPKPSPKPGSSSTEEPGFDDLLGGLLGGGS